MDRKTFEARHPDVPSEDVSRLLARHARWRTTALVAVGLLIVVLAMSAFATYRIHRAATHDAPRIAGEMASERYGAAQERLNARLGEARQLVGELFLLLGDIVEENPTLQTLEQEWRTANDNADLLLSDLAMLGERPVESSKALWSTGRDRIEAIIGAAARMILTIQEFIPNAVVSLQAARAEMTAESSFEEVVDAVELLLVPLMEGEPELVQRWSILRGRIMGWRSLVDEDIAAVRASMEGGEVTQEFFDRLAAGLF